MDDLSQSAREIAEVIGRDKALYLIGQMPPCGRRSWRVVIYVPNRLHENHALVRILGWEDARKMADAFGGEILQPSNCRHLARQWRNETICQWAKEGLPNSEIAARAGLSRRQIRNILAETAPEENGSGRRHHAPL